MKSLLIAAVLALVASTTPALAWNGKACLKGCQDNGCTTNPDPSNCPPCSAFEVCNTPCQECEQTPCEESPTCASEVTCTNLDDVKQACLSAAYASAVAAAECKAKTECATTEDVRATLYHFSYIKCKRDSVTGQIALNKKGKPKCSFKKALYPFDPEPSSVQGAVVQ